MMKDCVLIEGLTAFATIGVYEWEQKLKQKLVIDLSIEWDNKKAARTDDVSFCMDYEAVSNEVINYIESNAFKLIETVAESIAALILDKFNAPAVTVKISKPHAIHKANNVAVKITRFKAAN